MNWNARSNSTRRTYRNLTFDQLRGLILDGDLTEADWVQREGDPRWIEIGAVPELADAVPAFSFRHDRALLTEEEDMDMTPMIDVVFQLLLFFMIISTFQVQKAIGFPDPSDPKQSKNIPTLGQLGRDRIVLSVNAKNEIELLHYDAQGTAARAEPVKKVDLVSRFEQVARQERKTSVIIRADDKAHHEFVVAVIDAANLANMEDIRIAQPVVAKGDESPEQSEMPVAPKAGGESRTIEDK